MLRRKLGAPPPHWRTSWRRARYARPVTSIVIAAGLAVFSTLSRNPSAQLETKLRVGIALPEAGASSGLATVAEVLSSESLVGISVDGRPAPRLALRWTRSKDQRDWRFALPSEVRLHDGTNAKANIIATLLRRAATKPESLRFHPRLADFYEITAEDESTILMRSRTARILALEEIADLALTTDFPNGGIGPFVVDSLTPERLQLHGFSGYLGGAPAINKVEFTSYRSQRSAWAAMMRDDLDAVYEVDREAVEFLEKDTRSRVRSFLRGYVAGLVFNSARYPFQDSSVRRALSAAVDRAVIVKSAYADRGRVADGPLWPNYWGLPTDAKRTVYDRQLALALLKRLPIKGTDGQMPARLRVRCLVPELETQPMERIALLLQKQLYEVGVDLQLEPVSVRHAVSRLQAGDFEAVILEFFAVTPTWLDFFWHSPLGGRPITLRHGYSAADAELDAMQLARDEEELRRAITAVYQKMYDDPPAIFLAWPEVARAVSTRFEVPVPEGEDIMGANLRLWRPARAPRDTP